MQIFRFEASDFDEHFNQSMKKAHLQSSDEDHFFFVSPFSEYQIRSDIVEAHTSIMAPKASKPVVSEEVVEPSSVEVAVPTILPEADSSGGSDDESESESGTEEAFDDDKSRDGSEQEGDGSDGHDGDGSAPAVVEVPSSSGDQPRKVLPEDDFDDEEFQKILEVFVRAKKGQWQVGR